MTFHMANKINIMRDIINLASTFLVCYQHIHYHSPLFA